MRLRFVITFPPPVNCEALANLQQDPKDTFEDIPLDTRHHTFKTKPKFPREWRITPERQAQLEADRSKAARIDLELAEKGLLIDGGDFVRKAHEEAAKVAGAVKLNDAAIVAPAGKGGKRLSVRR